MNSPVFLTLTLALGTPIFLTTILFLVFRTVKKTADKEKEALVQEDILLDSGMRWIAVRFRNFRAPGFYRGVGFTRAWSSVLLTREQLVFTSGLRAGFFRYKRSDLGRFKAMVSPQSILSIWSDDPPGASGLIDFRFKVSDAASWVKALKDAGVGAAD